MANFNAQLAISTRGDTLDKVALTEANSRDWDDAAFLAVYDSEEGVQDWLSKKNAAGKSTLERLRERGFSGPVSPMRSRDDGSYIGAYVSKREPMDRDEAASAV